MKKLKLELDDLKVDSFVADRDTTGRGTVRGLSATSLNTWAESCQYGTGCNDSIFICDSHLCPLTEAPSAPNC